MVDQLKMTSPREYTQAQLEAFAWLPSDGSFRFTSSLTPEAIYDGLYEMVFWTDLVEADAPDGVLEPYRLTPAGQAEKARLIAEGKIEP